MLQELVLFYFFTSDNDNEVVWHELQKRPFAVKENLFTIFNRRENLNTILLFLLQQIDAEKCLFFGCLVELETIFVLLSINVK